MENYYNIENYNSIDYPNTERILKTTQKFFKYNSPQIKKFSTITINSPKIGFINGTIPSPFLVEDEKVSINTPMTNTYNMNIFKTAQKLYKTNKTNNNFSEERNIRFFRKEIQDGNNDYLNYNNNILKSNTINNITRETMVPRINQQKYYNFDYNNNFIIEDKNTFSNDSRINNLKENNSSQLTNKIDNLNCFAKITKINNNIRVENEKGGPIDQFINKENIDKNSIIQNKDTNKTEEERAIEKKALNTNNINVSYEKFLKNTPLKTTSNMKNNNSLIIKGQNANRVQSYYGTHPSNNIKYLNNYFGRLYKENQQNNHVPPFILDNGEILSNPNCTEYFRKTKTAPVTSYGYCQNQNFPNRSYMEDEGRVIENFAGDPNKILFNIFDGHGGHKVSKYLQLFFYKAMKAIINYNNLKIGFIKLFRAIDGAIKKLNCPNEGSTATILYIVKHPQTNKRILYCANVGDSRCVVVNKKGVYRLSYDDRVKDPYENERINKNGGIVVNNRIYGQLNLSRSFGDWRIKDVGVIVDPHFCRYEITEDDSFCIIASDGVWDVLRDEEFSCLEKMNVDTGKMSKIIINECLKRKSLDNLSIFVISLK